MPRLVGCKSPETSSITSADHAGGCSEAKMRAKMCQTKLSSQAHQVDLRIKRRHAPSRFTLTTLWIPNLRMKSLVAVEFCDSWSLQGPSLITSAFLLGPATKFERTLAVVRFRSGWQDSAYARITETRTPVLCSWSGAPYSQACFGFLVSKFLLKLPG